MNINATLLGQMITFGLFVWFCMKYIWPVMMSTLQEREAKIADGLAAAERGHHELALAQKKATEKMRELKNKEKEILEKAHADGNRIVEDAKIKAQAEADKIRERARADIAQEINQAKRALRQQVATVAIAGAEKIIARNIDKAANSDLVDQMIEQI